VALTAATRVRDADVCAVSEERGGSGLRDTTVQQNLHLVLIFLSLSSSSHLFWMSYQCCFREWTFFTLRNNASSSMHI